ncbi:hypothetical protein HZ326_18839 [Fusarium oxysporum f. sp. albedinis]|nr:Uncharacterized protein HZ326_19056 [Fusarium oxysporum f. sp. albedinis]KAJ0138209.1 hypothetical protein HZ326_18839 [Fusarium oxysporum f. sp. albedinis]
MRIMVTRIIRCFNQVCLKCRVNHQVCLTNRSDPEALTGLRDVKSRQTFELYHRAYRNYDELAEQGYENHMGPGCCHNPTSESNTGSHGKTAEKNL